MALGNTGVGISVNDSANNVIGGLDGALAGPCSGSCNLISGNIGNGIELRRQGAFSNAVIGNFIGVDSSGTVEVGNNSGILLFNAPVNQIGGRELEARNVISGNRQFGVHISGPLATGNEVVGNLIGPDVTNAVFVGNGLDGLNIQRAPGNYVGLGEPGLEGRNIIAGNERNGIVVTGVEAIANRLRGNEIHHNAELGIDLGLDAATFNDEGDGDLGPNGLVNFPWVTGAEFDDLAETTTVTGEFREANALPTTIDVYASAEMTGGPESPAQVYLGSTTDIDAEGNWTVVYEGELPPAMTVFNATATTAEGTSEFNQVVPLVFIPGIMGSRLTVNNASGVDELWPGGQGDKLPLNLFPNNPLQPANPVYPRDVIRILEVHVGPLLIKTVQQYAPILARLADAGYTEYQVGGNPLLQTAAGCDVATQRSNHPLLFVLAYDWRRSSAETAILLNDYIACVQQFYPNSPVNILTHSMGGLVARRYILDNPDNHHVHKLITIAAPFLGAPAVLYPLETGYYGHEISLLATASELKYIIQSFEGAHQLIPSPLYAAGRPILIERGWDFNENGNGDDFFVDYDELAAAFDTRYGGSAFAPGSITAAFHNFTTSHGSQDDWRQDSSGIRYYHIYGVQAAVITVQQLIASLGSVCRDSTDTDDLVCKVGPFLARSYGPGDGTVPVMSASRLMEVNGTPVNLNAPNALLYSFCSSSGSNDGDVEHGGIHQNTNVQALVLELLRHDREPLDFDFDYPCPLDTVITSATHGDLRIWGAQNVVVSDTLGNSTAPFLSEAGQVFYGELPGVELYAEEAGVSGALLRAPNPYFVTFVGAGQGVLIEWTVGVGSAIAGAVRYRDIDIPSGVAGRISITAGAISLHVDNNGDGILETLVPPTVAQSGPGLDVEPPTLSFATVTGAAGVEFTLSATDNLSGVKAIYYSLNGTTFHPYAGPFLLPLDFVGAVHAFADDHAANRVGIKASCMPVPVC